MSVGMAEEPRLRKDGTPWGSVAPARGSSRPPFPVGNELAVRHGAFSPRKIAERAEEVRALLAEVAPELSMPLFNDAVRRYVRAEARSQLLNEHVMARADVDGVKTVPPYLWTELARAESNAQKFGADCGMDAAGLARVQRDLGLASSARRQLRDPALPQLGERGREIRTRQGRVPDAS